jgi:hypothetical protein
MVVSSCVTDHLGTLDSVFGTKASLEAVTSGDNFSEVDGSKVTGRVGSSKTRVVDTEESEERRGSAALICMLDATGE